MLRIVLVGDCSPNVIAHTAIPKAIALATNEPHELHWLHTSKIDSAKSIPDADAIWCVPGSPYENMDGALTAIRFARERKIPFLGTCGGFQHALIEFARNVLNISDADHTESNPGARSPVVSKLSCALVHQSEELSVAAPLEQIYGARQITEAYQCSYGLNPMFRERFANSDLDFVAFNSAGDARAFHLKSHPFFFGTLFQPERSIATGNPHPLIAAFLQR